MKVAGQPMRPLRATTARDAVMVIDQRLLPHRLHLVRLDTPQAVFTAIRDMWVRGAPLIGATAAYGLALQMTQDASDDALVESADWLRQARPTAVNLMWAIDRMLRRLRPLPAALRATAAWDEADTIAEDDVAANAAIGRHGLALLQAIARRKSEDGRPGPVNVLTHCNAGWLATVDWGTATSPIYQAHEAGLPVHVWVDETRPRNQGASLTAWELGQAGVPHTLVADNAGGHLMQHGHVDIVIVGCDRVTARAATSATRSAPISRRWRRTTTVCRSMWRCRCPRWTARCTTAWPRSPSKSAARARSRTWPGERLRAR